MSEPAPTPTHAGAAEAIRAGRAVLGIELGSTRIKLCLIGDDPAEVLAVGGHAWENDFVDRLWTYDLADVWTGLQSAYAELLADAERRHGVRPTAFAALGVSAMMHGYLALDAAGEPLVPFRTWRNTNTGVAAAELTELFGVNIPLRWSIAHLHQAVLDAEPHLDRIAQITTLAGYVHERLTGRRVLGVGDASGMFPIDSATKTYDAALLARYDAHLAGAPAVADPTSGAVTDARSTATDADATSGAVTDAGATATDADATSDAVADTGSTASDATATSGAPANSDTAATATDAAAGPTASLPPLATLLPEVLVAGQDAGTLTPEGAALLDPTGTLHPGALLCPPEGDAGTGMVATHSVAPRTGNVSAGTSIFAMIVLERPLAEVHHELDLVTTPAGDAVAMVHCNNGASELAAWAGLFSRFSAAAGTPLGDDAVFEALFREALDGEADAGGVLAYNYLAGEPIAGLEEGRPLVVRSPESRFTLANFMRAQLYGVFGTLALGMRVPHDEAVVIDRMFAHGGVFRTAGVAQRFLAGALGAPVSVAHTASEGGAWGIAVLAAYAAHRAGESATTMTATTTAATTDAATQTHTQVQSQTTTDGASTTATASTGAGDAAASALDAYLGEHVFAGAAFETTEPDPADVSGFTAYLDRYHAGLAVQRAAVDAL